MTRIKPTDIVVGLALSLCFLGTLALAHESTWGAISIDMAASSKMTSYGIGGGDAKDEAIENAQKRCSAGGGATCVAVATYQDCGAVSASPTSGGWGIGATKQQAMSRAMGACKGEDCKIVVTECN